jgi:hypothetical protein
MINNVKRFFAVICGVLIVTVSCSAVAFATNHNIVGFYFNDVSTTKYTPYYGKSDNESSWYLSLKEEKYGEFTSTLASNNVFGFKMHRKTNDTVDRYHTLNHFVTSKKYDYKASVKKGDKMRLAGKKDDSSTSSEDLGVLGQFAP